MVYRLITIAAGAWLMFAPAVLSYGDPAASNDRLVGPTVLAVSFVAIWEVVRSVRWVALPLGVWLVAAPFVLGYADTSVVVSSVITGVIVVATTPPAPADPGRFGGGWRTVMAADTGPGSPSR